MMRRARNRRDDLPMMADINVTSLVDIAFTLLVIFIITAPVLQGGIEITVPEADVQALTAEDDPLFVTVMPDGRVFLGETELTIDEFRSSFNQVVDPQVVDRVYLRGDATASWEIMVQIMGVVTTAGVDFSVVAEPWVEG